MIQEVQNRGKALNEVCIILDNTSRENKNKYVVSFCNWLVEIGVATSMRIFFLPVGYA
jgi:hypothetical protein